MANHRSPKPGLQVRLLPLLPLFQVRKAGVEGSTEQNGSSRERIASDELFARCGWLTRSEPKASEGHRLLPLLPLSW